MTATFPGDLLQVHNHSEEPITLTWDGRSVTVPPGGAKTASFEQIVNHFGHPASGDVEQKVFDPTGAFHIVPSRDDEVRRISIKGGWDLASPHTGGLQLLVPPPAVEVYDMDGDRVWCCIDDPKGEHAMTSSGSPAPAAAPELIAHLQRQIDMLKAAQGVSANATSVKVAGLPASEPIGGELPDLVDVPTDD